MLPSIFRRTKAGRQPQTPEELVNRANEVEQRVITLKRVKDVRTSLEHSAYSFHSAIPKLEYYNKVRKNAKKVLKSKPRDRAVDELRIQEIDEARESLKATMEDIIKPGDDATKAAIEQARRSNINMQLRDLESDSPRREGIFVEQLYQQIIDLLDATSTQELETLCSPKFWKQAHRARNSVITALRSFHSKLHLTEMRCAVVRDLALAQRPEAEAEDKRLRLVQVSLAAKNHKIEQELEQTIKMTDRKIRRAVRKIKKAAENERKRRRCKNRMIVMVVKTLSGPLTFRHLVFRV